MTVIPFRNSLPAFVLLGMLTGAVSCSSLASDRAAMRIEIPYSASTVFGKSEGEDGAIERSMMLRDQQFTLEQRGRRLVFDLQDFPGDMFIAHQSSLRLPISFELPDGTLLRWTRGRVHVGSQSVREPNTGSHLWDPERGAFTAIDSD